MKTLAKVLTILAVVYISSVSFILFASYRSSLSYQFYEPVSGSNLINITQSNSLVDCHNNTLSGTLTWGNIPPNTCGIYAHNLSNITIRNCKITSFEHGICLHSVSNIIINNVRIHDLNLKGSSGILATNSNNVSIYNTVIQGIGDGSKMGGFGILFYNTNSSIIQDFYISWVSDACLMPNGYNNTIRSGTLRYCGRSISLSFPTSQGNTFEQISVLATRFNERNIFKSIINLGEATGSTYPHIFHNNTFINKGSSGGLVDFIEDSPYQYQVPQALFNNNYYYNITDKPFIISCQGLGCTGYYIDNNPRTYV